MLYYFLLTFLFSIFFYLIGHIISLFWSKEKKYTDFETFFFKLVIGLVSVIVSFAIIHTKGNTVFIGIILMSLLYLLYNRDKLSHFNFSNLFKIEGKPLFLFIGVLLIFNALFYFAVFPDLINVHNDFIYFGALTDYLNLYGIESNTLNIILETAKPNFYHYINEWGAAFISWVSNEIGLVSLVYIYFPLLLGTLFIGLVCLTQKITNKSILSAIGVSFLFFILSPIAGGGGVPALFSLGGVQISIGSYFSTPVIKFLPVIILLLTTILTNTRENLTKTIYLFLVIAYVWPVTTIAIFGGIFLYIVFQKFRTKRFLKKEFVLLLVGVCYMVLFYLFQSSKIQLSDQSNSSHLDFLLNYIKNDLNILEHIKYFFGTIGMRFYYYSIFILMIIFNWKLLKTYINPIKKYQSYILLYCFIAFCGLLGKSALYFMNDSNQLFENIFDHSFMYIVTFLLFLMVLNNKWNYLFVVFFLSTSIITYQKQVSQKSKEMNVSLVENLQNEFGVNHYTFASAVKADNSLFGHINQTVYPPLLFLRAYTNSYFPINISLYDRYQVQYIQETNYTKKIRFQSLMKRSPFYYYVEKNGILKVDWKTKYDFLKEHKIDYLVFEKGSLEPEFMELIKNKKIIDISSQNVEIVKLNWD